MEIKKPDRPRNRRTALRKSPRNSVKVECRRGSLGMGKNLVAQFLDISEGGVRLAVTETLDPKKEVEVVIHGVNLKKPIKRVATVCWLLPMENGQFCVGLEFQKRLPYQDVFQFARP